jgi:hypothetical protein
MAKGFAPDIPTDSQHDRGDIAAHSQEIRITFAEPRGETLYTGVELAATLGWSESTLRGRFKTVSILVDRGALERDELIKDGRYTERARNFLQSLGDELDKDRMCGPRWLDEQEKTLKTFAKMSTAVPVEVVEDSAGYSGAIALYQKQNAQLSTEIGDLTEAALTDVQALRAQFGQFRQQRRQAIAQQAVQDAVEDFKVYEATYAATAGNLTVAAGNAPAA